jgi:hypothetical protein
MAKMILICITVVFMFNILLSFVFFHENRKSSRYAGDEIAKAGLVLMMSVEENQANYEIVKTGEKTGLTYDADTLFLEFAAFIKNCRYIDGNDVKMKMLVFGGAITYFNLRNEEVYSEPYTQGEGITDIKNKIKRQLIKMFPGDGFHINKGLFEGIEDGMIVLIYEKRNRNIGFTENIENSYYYSKLKIS